VDSAGTGSWHIGESPDHRSMQAAQKRDYDLSSLRARQVKAEDLERFDYIFAMDRLNLHDLLEMASPYQQEKISLFLQHGSSDYDEVPDPYYSGKDGFELVLDLVEDASASLVRKIAGKHNLA
jgi:protein-tyrosine phosphatase